jgi:hypothetical protein
MSNKFDKFMELPEGKVRKSKSVSVKQESTEKSSSQNRIKGREKFSSPIRIHASAEEELNLLVMATKEKKVALLDQAIHLLFETLALENQQVKAFQTLLNDFSVPDRAQTSLEDFM